jgi:hypothetical protein
MNNYCHADRAVNYVFRVTYDAVFAESKRLINYLLFSAINRGIHSPKKVVQSCTLILQLPLPQTSPRLKICGTRKLLPIYCFSITLSSSSFHSFLPLSFIPLLSIPYPNPSLFFPFLSSFCLISCLSGVRGITKAKIIEIIYANR